MRAEPPASAEKSTPMKRSIMSCATCGTSKPTMWLALKIFAYVRLRAETQVPAAVPFTDQSFVATVCGAARHVRMGARSRRGEDARRAQCRRSTRAPG
jgi:hypothetical protein